MHHVGNHGKEQRVLQIGRVEPPACKGFLELGRICANIHTFGCIGSIGLNFGYQKDSGVVGKLQGHKGGGLVERGQNDPG